MTRLSRVVPKKKECLLGGPITKPMDLAITLCPFLLIFDPVLHWPIWPTLTGKQRRGRQSKPPRYKSYYCYPRYRPLIQPSKRLHASIFYLMKWKPRWKGKFVLFSKSSRNSCDQFDYCKCCFVTQMLLKWQNHLTKCPTLLLWQIVVLMWQKGRKLCSRIS